MESLVVGTALVLFIMAGTFVSFAMQAGAIVLRRSSNGVSALSVQLLFCANALILLNLCIINLGDWYRCGLVEMLPLAQSSLDVVYSFVLVLVAQAFLHGKRRFMLSASSLGAFVCVVLAAAVLAIILPYVFVARIFGGLAALCTAVMWIPQIAQTHIDPEFRDLSIYAVYLRAAGCLFDGVYKGVFAAEDWSVWVTSAVSFVFLMLLVAVYHNAARRARAAMLADPLQVAYVAQQDVEISETDESVLGLEDESDQL